MDAKKEEARKRIEFLRSEIERHDRLYYVEARPVIGDRDYDILYAELLRLEGENPEFASPDSPTQRVGGEPVSSFAQVRHSPPMRSLDKTHSKDELRDFDAMLARSGVARRRYAVEPKVDGVSISLLYENRRLVRAATRGNGTVGDDVTNNVRTIRSIPLRLPDGAPGVLEVRGEIYMTRDGFLKLNEREEEAGRDSFANPRNATAGSLKQMDPQVAASRPLDAVIYNGGGAGCGDFATHCEMTEAFRSWGFPVAPWSRTCDGIEEAIAAVDELETLRHSFRFEIDGAVLKLDDRSLYAALGDTAHAPRWARAYKYAPERAETTIEGITVQVGRTGVLTPVAELAPVPLAGSVISRATLHNAGQIERMDIRVGDRVWLIKAGDVIPAIDSVIAEKRTGAELPFAMPDRCPACGGETVRREGEVALRCANPACPAKLLRRLVHFASRNALDISALGDVAAEALVNAGLVKDLLDVFELPKDRLEALDVGGSRFGKNAETLLAAAERARSLPLHRWLYAIGIPGVGVTAAADMAAEHGSIYELPGSQVLENVLENDRRKGREHLVLAIKPEAARAALSFFSGDYGRRFLERLRGLGIDPKPADRKSAAGGPLAGAGFVLTGTLSRPREEYAEMICAAGGTVQNAVSKKTAYLVAGENTGKTKTEKALALGTRVIDEEGLLKLLAGEPPAAAPAAPEIAPENAALSPSSPVGSRGEGPLEQMTFDL